MAVKAHLLEVRVLLPQRTPHVHALRTDRWVHEDQVHLRDAAEALLHLLGGILRDDVVRAIVSQIVEYPLLRVRCDGRELGHER